MIPLVEMVPAPWTEEETVSRCWALMEAAGMEPVRLTREIDGFIANRLQAALLWEAFRLLEGGYATAKDIDTTISAGLGRRWAFIGPFETIDLNAPGGLADFCARLHDGFYEFVKQGEPAQPLSDAVVFQGARGTPRAVCRWPGTATARLGATAASWASPRTCATQGATRGNRQEAGRRRLSVAEPGELLAQLPQAACDLLVAGGERAGGLAALVEVAARDSLDLGTGRDVNAGARAGLHVRSRKAASRP